MKYLNQMITATLLVALLGGQSVMADPPAGKGNSGKSNQSNNGQGQGQGQGQYQGKQKDDPSNPNGNLVMAGITAISARNLALNTGAAGYAPLPPGITKNLARGKPLPPGIAKKSVPGPMLGQLPDYPGYEWMVAGTDLILVGIGTAIVADILRNVFQ